MNAPWKPTVEVLVAPATDENGNAIPGCWKYTMIVCGSVFHTIVATERLIDDEIGKSHITCKLMAACSEFIKRNGLRL